jgi:LuxR family maltose regulon positive regulatory protein
VALPTVNVDDLTSPHDERSGFADDSPHWSPAGLARTTDRRAEPPAGGREGAVRRMTESLAAGDIGAVVDPGTGRGPGPAPTADHPRLVPRDRLNRRVDEATGRALTLVVGGAGWGKTSLLRSWVPARRRSAPVAWLTLRTEHREPTAFEAAIVSAIRHSVPVPARAPVIDPEPSWDTTGTSLRELGPLPVPVVLVLDDFHVLDEAPSVAWLAALVERLPAELRLAVLSRTEPALPLHRLRASGELTEFTAADLAFDADEATSLLMLPSGSELANTDAAALVEQTEGWPVGLLLSTGTAEGAGGPEPVDRAETTTAARDYLLREVFSALPANVRRFLLRTSIPDRVCADLATALTGETHGLRLLERLQRTTGFVTLRRPGSRWFQYHRQLREVLRRQLELDEPETVRTVHRLTARWYTGENMLPEALRHATAAADWNFIGRMVAGHALILSVSGQRESLLDALRRIPGDVLPTTPELTLCEALLLFAEGDLPAIPARIARARAMLAGRDPSGRVAVDLALDVLEAGAVLRPRGDMPGLITAIERILARLQAARPDEVPCLRQLRTVVLGTKGVGLLWMDQLDQADRTLWSGLTGARLSGLHLAEIDARSHLGLLAFLQGSIHEAEEHVTGALALARQHRAEHTPHAASAHLTRALIELERDDVTEAQLALRQILHSPVHPPERAISVVASTLVRIRILLTGRDPHGARALLRSTTATISSMDAPRFARWIRLTDAEIALALHDPDHVIALYPPGDHPPLIPAEQACLGCAHLALGQHARAEELLTRAANSPDMVAAVTAWIALALLFDKRGNTSRSATAMSHATALARRTGIRRPFHTFDQGRITALTGRQRWLEDDDSRVFSDDSAEIGIPPGAMPATPLSEREIDVLRFLPTVLTAQEIAKELGISVNTVKAHTRSIYRKLDAARRREAVAQARRFGLL